MDQPNSNMARIDINDLVEVIKPGSHGRLDAYYSTKDGREIATINWLPTTGNIGYFNIYKHEDRRRGLGTQILERTIDRIKSGENPPSHVWADTKKDHPFWKAVFGKTWEAKNGVSSGFYKEI